MTKEQLQMIDLENTYDFQFEIKNKLGFQIIKDLATTLHIKLKINSEIKMGTTVNLLLPIEKADKTI